MPDQKSLSVKEVDEYERLLCQPPENWPRAVRLVADWRRYRAALEEIASEDDSWDGRLRIKIARKALGRKS